MFPQDVLDQHVTRADLRVDSQRERSIVADVANLPNRLHVLVLNVLVLLPTLATAKHLRTGTALNLQNHKLGQTPSKLLQKYALTSLGIFMVDATITMDERCF